MAVVASHPLTNCQPPRPVGLADRIGRAVQLWRRRTRERHAFARIDEVAMQDLGLSRWQVERELAKPFWRD